MVPPSSRSVCAPTVMDEATQTVLRRGGWRELVDVLGKLDYKSWADLKTLVEKDHKKLKLSVARMRNFVLFVEKPTVMVLGRWLLA